MSLLKKLKDTLKILEDDEDDLLNNYLIAADQFIKNAIGTDIKGFYDRPEVQPQLEIAILARAGSYYTYRVSLANTQAFRIDATMNSIIGQLRGMYDLAEEEEKKNG